MKIHWQNSCSIWQVTSLILLLLVLGCQQKEPTPEPAAEIGLPDEQAENVRLIAYNGEQIEYEMTARKVDKYYSRNQTLADSVTVLTYNPDSSLKSKLVCDNAIVDDARNLLTASGQVVITSENGILQTPYLVWNRNTDKILATSGVTIIRDENILKGQELKTDIKLENIEISQVSATGRIDAEDIDW